MKALLLANPICLKRHGWTEDRLVALLADMGIDAEAETMSAEPDLRAWRERLEGEARPMLIAAGGDGTVHAVANLAVPLGLPVGVLPLGTANDFARTLHLPTDIERAAEVIATARPLGVDVGTVNGHYFLNAAHLGLGVETAKRTKPGLKEWVGPMAYMLAAVQAYMQAEPLTINCCFDERGCVTVEASQLLVSNGRFFGGGMQAAREATLEDGLFDVHVMKAHIGPGEALRFAAAAKLGSLEDQEAIFYARTARFTAQLSRPAELNLDGELVNLGEALRFEVLPRALAVYAESVAIEPLVEPGGVTRESI